MNGPVGTGPGSDRWLNWRAAESVLGRAFAALRLVDGTTGAPLDVPLRLSDLRARVPGGTTPSPLPAVVVKPGLLGFFYPDDIEIVPGVAPAAKLDAATAHAAISIAGRLDDPARRYNPTVFDLTLAPQAALAETPSVAIFRTPFGTPVARLGGLFGTVRREGTAPPAPVAYARVEASFTFAMRLGDTPSTTVIAAETDVAGDFVLPLERLPALTGTETSRAGKLAIRVPSDPAAPASGASPLTAVSIRRPNGTAAGALDVDVRPGAIVRVPPEPEKVLVIVPA